MRTVLVLLAKLFLITGSRQSRQHLLYILSGGFAQAAGEAVQKLGAGKSTNEEFLQELQDAWDNLSK